MHPARSPNHRPIAAQHSACDTLAIVHAGCAPDDTATHPAPFCAGRATCNTFPLNWPSLNRAGPLFWRIWRAGQKNTSPKPVVVVALETITTNDRGISCGKFWQWAFWLCRFQAAYKTIFSAVWSALVRAQPLPMLRAEIWLRALFWAALQAQFATILTSAARATNRAKPLSFYEIRPNGQIARLAFCILRQGFWPALGMDKELAHV